MTSGSPVPCNSLAFCEKNSKGAPTGRSSAITPRSKCLKDTPIQ